ncbi:MAG: GatB/YqeY domain-containing protein [Candidatus Uhrbacteria bacterium]
MALRETIQHDLVSAMKAREAERLSCLRMLKTAIDNAAIDVRAKGVELSEEDVISCVQTQAKRLRESIVDFRKGNREDLVTSAEAELAIIDAYLPEQLREDDIRSVVEAKRAENDTMSMGQLMGVVMQELQGKADGGLVRKVVEEVLQGTKS